jgi:hypothetical protein
MIRVTRCDNPPELKRGMQMALLLKLHLPLG